MFFFYLNKFTPCSFISILYAILEKLSMRHLKVALMVRLLFDVCKFCMFGLKAGNT